MTDPTPPLRALIETFPVVVPPMVRFWLLVVWMEEAPLKVKFPDSVADPVLANTWNLAEEVDVPPIARSKVVLIGYTTPAFCVHQFVPWLEAMVIPPAVLVTVIPNPGVRVAKEYPVPFPISKDPLAAEEPFTPVPPLETPKRLAT